MNRIRRIAIIVVTVSLVAFAPVSCAKAPPPPPAGSLVVEPAELELGFPAVLGTPITFSGSGWPANDLIVVEMELPSGVVNPMMEPEERNAPLGNGYAGANGNFKATMGATAILFTFFRTQMTPEFTIDMDKFDPLPPGTYTVIATAVESGVSTTATMELKAPPPKE
jgi:hypothetical protein